MKLARRMGLVVGLALLAVVILLIVVVVSINGIARTAIEKGGTYALGVPTHLDGANVGLVSGTFSMSGLRVENPEGYTGPNFLTLGNGGVAVSLGTLQQDVVELPSLRLETITASLERKGGSSNYQTILDHVKSVTGGGGETEPTQQPSEGGKKFVVRELVIRDVRVHLDVFGAPEGGLKKLTAVDIPIDEIRLQNVGQTGTGVGGTGVTMGEMASIIVRAVLAAAVEKGGGLIPGDILGELQGSLASLGDLQGLGMSVVADAKGVVEGVAGEVVKEGEKVVEEGKKKIEEIGEGLKNLVPKKPN
ncbi:MAG: hypothetical protein AB7G17_01530 [Phycisphaerales bacterium]